MNYYSSLLFFDILLHKPITFEFNLCATFAAVKIHSVYMQYIKNQEFWGERPLFGSHDLTIENVIIHEGESALKECRDIKVDACRFEGKYPLWHIDGFEVRHSLLTDGARAALWYYRNLVMCDTRIEAPKTLREMDGVIMERVQIPNATETFWKCANVVINDVEVNNADYVFMHSHDITIHNYRQQGNYSFQYCRNVEIHNAVLDTRDAFWETENVTVYDSELKGAYLGWHSKRLRLVNCKISGTQPLCYAQDLVLENCTFDKSCDLAFEYSSVKATINGSVTSIKNPTTGYIEADGVDEMIIDDNILPPANCRILVRSVQQTR